MTAFKSNLVVGNNPQPDLHCQSQLKHGAQQSEVGVDLRSPEIAPPVLHVLLLRHGAEESPHPICQGCQVETLLDSAHQGFVQS